MPDLIQEDYENRIFTVDGVRYPSVSDVLQSMGFIDTTWLSESGRDNGTRRHRVMELDNLDDLIEESVDLADMPFLNASRQGKSDTGIKILEVEQRHYNHVYKFCGKPDILVMFRGHKEIWDFKTGSKMPHYKYQIGGYLSLYDECFYGRCVYLQANGKYKLGERYGSKERREFLQINAVYQLRKECVK
jgi:hypothetical protein